MSPTSRFRCPSCGFTIFNRRIATCESCSAVLPAELLFTAQHLAVIDAEHARNEQIRAKLASERRKPRTWGDGDVDSGDDGGGGGDGGGD